MVTSPHGPEAGVWVIAETTELPTKFTRIVVTDDKGRYLVPDLPTADYYVWVRGYGLVDSPKLRGAPGKRLDLEAVPAPNEADAAQYYPAIYWYSMLKIPDAGQFGGKSDIPKDITQVEWLTTLKNRDCVGCHQLGQLATRTIPAAFSTMPSLDAWMRRVQSGQAAASMVNPLAGHLGGVPFKYFADWTDRIAKGELPHDKPPRPHGLERNVVITEWAWGSEHMYLHDEISTDKRNPTVNAYGPIFGSTEYSTEDLPILDPKTNTRELVQGAGARSRHAGIARPRPCRGFEADDGLGLLGRREDLEPADQQPQRHVRREGAPVADRGGARARDRAGLLQAGLDLALGAGVPARSRAIASWRCSTRRR